MPLYNELFFHENIKKVNALVNKFFLFAIIIPVTFIVLTLAHIWIVPHLWSVSLIFYSVISYLLLVILNAHSKTRQAACYTGIGLLSVLVMILGTKDIIQIRIAYCLVPLISCLYYSRRLTLVTTLIAFVSMISTVWIKATSGDAMEIMRFNLENYNSISYFISESSALSIEFIFIFVITSMLSKRTNSTLSMLLDSMNERKRAADAVQEKNRSLHETQEKIIQFVAEVLGSHDLFTGRHVIHTKTYVMVISEALRNNGYYTDILTDETIKHYTTAAFLHDIGKIHIPEGVLNKIGKFTPQEFQLMQTHPAEGKKLLQFLPKIEDGTFNKIAIDMAYCHHEKWDGTGYPQKISGEQIPLCARIMAAADVLDALISQRLYKEPMSVDEAMEIFKTSSGTHFEPCIAETVIKCRETFYLINKEFQENESSTNAEELAWWQDYHANLSASSSSL